MRPDEMKCTADRWLTVSEKTKQRKNLTIKSCLRYSEDRSSQKCLAGELRQGSEINTIRGINERFKESIIDRRSGGLFYVICSERGSGG